MILTERLRSAASFPRALKQQSEVSEKTGLLFLSAPAAMPPMSGITSMHTQTVSSAPTAAMPFITAASCMIIRLNSPFFRRQGKSPLAPAGGITFFGNKNAYNEGDAEGFKKLREAHAGQPLRRLITLEQTDPIYTFDVFFTPKKSCSASAALCVTSAYSIPTCPDLRPM